jgi:hypothetical protein
VICSGPIGATSAFLIGRLEGASWDLVARLAVAALLMAPLICGALYGAFDAADDDSPMV